MIRKTFEQGGVTVGELIEYLKTLPQDADVCVNKEIPITWEEEDGTKKIEYGWVFDSVWGVDYCERTYPDTDYVHKVCYFDTK